MLLFLLLAATFDDTNAAKNRGGSRNGRSRGRGRTYGSRMPIPILHRNSASANYYENKDVRLIFAKAQRYNFNFNSNYRVQRQLKHHILNWTTCWEEKLLSSAWQEDTQDLKLHG